MKKRKEKLKAGIFSALIICACVFITAKSLENKEDLPVFSGGRKEIRTLIGLAENMLDGRENRDFEEN